MPLSRFFKVTAALGMTAPDESVTVPPMSPVVTVCAERRVRLSVVRHKAKLKFSSRDLLDDISLTLYVEAGGK